MCVSVVNALNLKRKIKSPFWVVFELVRHVFGHVFADCKLVSVFRRADHMRTRARFWIVKKESSYHSPLLQSMHSRNPTRRTKFPESTFGFLFNFFCSHLGKGGGDDAALKFSFGSRFMMNTSAHWSRFCSLCRRKLPLRSLMALKR